MKSILFALALLALKACGVPELDPLPIHASDSRITLRDPHIFGLVEGEFRFANSVLSRIVVHCEQWNGWGGYRFPMAGPILRYIKGIQLYRLFFRRSGQLHISR